MNYFALLDHKPNKSQVHGSCLSLNNSPVCFSRCSRIVFLNRSRRMGMRQFLKCLSYGNNVLVVKEDATDLDLTANAMTLWIRW